MNKTIALLTSGGDAPGMNAAIRAIVVKAQKMGFNCVGFEYGFNGLIDNQTRQLTVEDVQHISHQGGTILKSARCPRMMTSEGINQAAQNMQKLNLAGLIVIGGDGSFQGANALCQVSDVAIVGIPGTIDNDVDGCDYTIGFDTACNTAIQSVDKIRDTADAFDRAFFIEVMGRNSGHIALNVGLAVDAEYIIVPEQNLTDEQIEQKLLKAIKHHYKTNSHNSFISIIAEHSYTKGTAALAKEVESKANISCRSCELGHIQRGGVASAADRVLAIKLAELSFDALTDGKTDVMIGVVNQSPIYTPFKETGTHQKVPDKYLLEQTEKFLQ